MIVIRREKFSFCRLVINKVGKTVGNGGLYMIPRSDGILLGGTYERNQWDATPDPLMARQIIDGHKAFFNAMEDPWART